MKSTGSADERGFGLLEVLVAMAIALVTLTIFLSALATGSVGVSIVNERVTAENIARSQLEHVKETGFTDYYAPTAISQPGYTATISATTISADLQLITVTISNNSESILTIEDYKVNR